MTRSDPYTGTLHGPDAKSFSLHHLMPHKYVKIVAPNAPNVTQSLKLTQLKTLSLLFKNSISFPLLNYAKASLGLSPALGSLLVLPEELIMLSLMAVDDPVALCRLSQTCHCLRRLSSDGRLWKRMFERSSRWQHSYHCNIMSQFLTFNDSRLAPSLQALPE